MNFTKKMKKGLELESSELKEQRRQNFNAGFNLYENVGNKDELATFFNLVDTYIVFGGCVYFVPSLEVKNKAYINDPEKYQNKLIFLARKQIKKYNYLILKLEEVI